ncbi:Ribonuclease H [Thermaerobacter marianensis DSM 12885]|uniref:Ribonuclease HII n=1 Tax=Thermaerobacter marianensis (strain ATCC 700841 / DSM 12885 / JCM 10246 / 7p75a) TaxID=644966 RepID=E6SJL5_THEM7|nr:ribonuclease HII [Thermaerobacter marianensis]ADU51078.1 Ribonuclease H [Thermaerobacter marianensis DSM 12885]
MAREGRVPPEQRGERSPERATRGDRRGTRSGNGGGGGGTRRPSPPSLAVWQAKVEAVPAEELPGLIRELEADPRSGARALAARARRRWERWRQARERWAELAAAQDALVPGGRVAGVDEVGRGCLAGPVVAAAVILSGDACLPGLDDSKRLKPAARDGLAAAVRRQALAWAVGIATPAEIDALNIWHATRLAMRRALDALPVPPQRVVVDGRSPGDLGYPVEAVVDGDARFAAIAAASVVAKVFRDAWMARLDRVYPVYGFARHKGYATAEHRQALALYGPCPEHRRSFLPVRQAEGAPPRDVPESDEPAPGAAGGRRKRRPAVEAP